MKRRRILLFGVAGLFCAAALLAIAILLIGRFGDTEGRVIGTTLLLAGYGVVALPGAILLDQGRDRPLAEGALGLAGLAAALAIISVWGFSDVENVGKSVGTATILAVAAAQVSALEARRKEPEPPIVRRLFAASCVTATIAAGVAVVLLWTQPSVNLYARLLGALVVLDLLLVALQPLTAALASDQPHRVGTGTPERRATGGARAARAASRVGRVGCSPSRPACSGSRARGRPYRGGRTARRCACASGRRSRRDGRSRR